MAKRTLFIRNIEDTAVDRIKRAAGARQLTMAEYIEKLVDLHDATRTLAEFQIKNSDDGVSLPDLLASLGLQTITG